MSAQGGATPGLEGGKGAPFWVGWSDSRAPHVEARYTARVWDEEAKMHEEQRVEATCTHPGCGATFKRGCSSGRPREILTTFVLVHLHRDPLAPPAPPFTR